jgi:diguanylate cyclase (GGDEF)-like protein/PAS domain S-box-containing protein
MGMIKMLNEKNKTQTILIVEDTKINAKLLFDVLKELKRSVRIVKVYNGEEALEVLNKTEFDLILLDIILPGISGYELIELLKDHPKNSSTPVIFISSLKDEIKGLKLGAVDYITKPFKKEEVLARAKTQLELKEAKDIIEEENESLKALFDNGTEPIVLYDRKLNLIKANNKFKKLFKYNISELKGKNIREVAAEMSNQPVSNRAIRDILSGKQVEIEEVRYTKTGRKVNCLIKGIPIQVRGNFKGVYVMYVNITELKQKEEKIRYISFHDQLTGLYNRRFFEAELERFNKSRKLPISIIVADINNLKAVNDSQGHKIGDHYIKKAAGLLKKVMRSEDILARIGGDEFAAVLSSTSFEKASEIVERILEEINDRDYNLAIPLSISAGTAVMQNQDQDINQVFAEADKEMYIYKKNYYRENSLKKSFERIYN